MRWRRHSAPPFAHWHCTCAAIELVAFLVCRHQHSVQQRKRVPYISFLDRIGQSVAAEPKKRRKKTSLLKLNCVIVRLCTVHGHRLCALPRHRTQHGYRTRAHAVMSTKVVIVNSSLNSIANYGRLTLTGGIFIASWETQWLNDKFIFRCTQNCMVNMQ